MPKIIFIPFLLLFFFTHPFSAQDSDVVIYRISNNPADNTYDRTSSLGGSTFYVKGSGFSPENDNNMVFVNGVKAVVSGANAAYLIFDTPEVDSEFDAALEIKVLNPSTGVVMSGTCQTTCKIYYRLYYTPQLKRIIPRSAGPQEYVNFYGDARAANSDAITDIKIGPFICDRAVLDVEDYTSGLQTYKCRVAPETEAGFYKAMFKTDKGFMKISNEFTSIWNKKSYEFKCVPYINEISSQIGSPLGQIITIKGYGFSSKNSNNTVKIGKHDCLVSSSDIYNIKCEVQSTENAAKVSLKGAGLDKWVYDGTNSDLWKIENEKFKNAFFTKQITLPLLTSSNAYEFDRFPVGEDIEKSTVEIWLGYFLAPTTGSYRFFLTNDDGAELLLSNVANSPDYQFLQKIAYDYTYNSYAIPFFSTPYAKETQISQNIELKANEYYLISAIRRQGGGQSHMMVGVEVPNDEWSEQSMARLVRIDVKYGSVNREILKVDITGFKKIGQFKFALEARNSAGASIYYKETAYLDLTVSESALKTALVNSFGWTITTPISITQYDSTGATITPSALVIPAAISISITIDAYRQEKMLQIPPKLGFKQLETNDLATKIVLTTVQEPSPPIQGSFSISYNGTILDPIPANTSKIGDFFAPVKLDKTAFFYISSTPQDEHYYIIKLVGVMGGDIKLESNDATGGEEGSQVNIQIQKIEEGSNNTFYYPIPSEMLFTLNNESESVMVVSNGIAGRCYAESCNYAIVPDKTPKITSFSVTDSVMTITLSNYADYTINTQTIFINFGGNSCPTASITLPTITCNIPKNADGSEQIEAGKHLPFLHIEKIGYAIYADDLPTYDVTLAATSKSPLSGSANGGTLINIIGSGFPLSLPSSGLTVTLGDTPAQIISSSSTQLSIKSPTIPTPGDKLITISYKELQITIGNFNYDASLTPTIIQLSLTEASPVQKTDFEIDGTSFGSDKAKIRVFLENEFKNETIYELAVLSVEPTKIKCLLGGGQSGVYFVRVEVDGIGASIPATTDSNKFAYTIVVSSVEPVEGGTEGGTVVVIKGRNFSPVKNENQVYIGDDVNKYCDIIEASATELKCKTRKMTTANFIDASIPIFVAQKVSAYAVCPFFFKFVTVNTPMISSTGELTLNGGDVQVLDGTTLLPEDGKSIKVEFYLIASESLVYETEVVGESISAAQIKFTMPFMVDGTYKIRVLVENIGYAVVPDELTIVNSFGITEFIVNEGKLASTVGSRGGFLIKIKGNGFRSTDKVIVKDVNSYCNLVSYAVKEIVCITNELLDNTHYEVFIYRIDKTTTGCTTCVIDTSQNLLPIITSVTTDILTLGSNLVLNLDGTSLKKSDVNPIPYLNQIDSINKVFVSRIAGAFVSSTDTTVSVSFNGIQSGNYSFSLYYEEYGFSYLKETKLKTLTVKLTDLTLDMISSSIYGGKTASLAGTGFPDMSKKDINYITICDSICDIVSFTSSSIDFTIPKLLTKNLVSTYTLESSESVLQPDFKMTSDNIYKQNLVNDGLTSTYYDSTKAGCYIIFDFGESFQIKFKEIDFYMNLAKGINDYINLIFEFSNDLTTFIPLYTLDNNIKTGWNKIPVTTDVAAYRYVRLKDPSGTKSRCNLAEIAFYGVKLYTKYNDNLLTDTLTCDVNIFINGYSYNLPSKIEYKASEMPKITGVSPVLGPSSGNTDVTITGEGFGTSSAAVEVKIDAVPCVIKTVIATQIVCTTGARTSFVPPSFTVRVNGNNALAKNLLFAYIDRWSDSSTWGGEDPPKKGDSVYIPSGQNVLFDVSTPELYSIMVEGSLIFEDKDMELHANFLVCMGGRIQIGTFENPFTSKLIITMYGNKEAKQLPEYGNKVWAIHGCILDMHGVPKQYTWTLLSETALANANQIKLIDPVDWSIGDQIAIASTDFNHNNSEVRSISAISADKKTLTLDSPLLYQHYSAIEKFDNYEFPMQGEVGLLTRNIVYQGDDDPETTIHKYGAHIMIHHQESIGRISYCEFTRVGQGTTIGRYPIHFHRVGDASESYVIGNAVHNSFARVCTVHNTNFLRVQKNVGYHIFGHAYFIEDGIETNNVVEDNLVISVIQIWTLINTDVTASGYWVTNPNNIIRRNRAAGGDWFGFWYKLQNRVTGPSYDPNICPDGIEMGVFRDNVAHSWNGFGMRIDDYMPRKYPCADPSNFDTEDWYSSNVPGYALFENFVSWKNFENGVMFEHIGTVEFRNFLIADNRLAGFQISRTNYTRIDQAFINGAIIVGKTGNVDPDNSRYQNSVGMITPRTDFFLVKNVSFYNFDKSLGMVAIKSCSKCWHPKLKITGGKITKFTGLTFKAVDQRVLWEPLSTKKEIFIDLDGSLTSVVGNQLVAYHRHLDGISECANISSEIYDESMICGPSVKIIPIMFRNMQPNEAHRGLEIRVTRVDGDPKAFNASIIPHEKFYKIVMFKIFVDTAYTWSIPFVTGYMFNFHFQNGNLDWTHMNLYPSQYYDSTSAAIVLRHNYSDSREDYTSKRLGWNTSTNVLLTNLSTIPNPKTNDFNNGDYYLDLEPKVLYLGLNGKTNGTLDIDSVKCRLTCPKDVTTAVTEDLIRKWSNASMWPNGVVPPVNSAVVIPKEWRVLLDIDPPNLASLIIDGELIFDSNRALSKLNSYIIWVRKGNITAGSPLAPFTNKIIINILGDKKSEGLTIDNFIETGNKILAVTGTMNLYGQAPSVIWTRLSASALIGGNTLKLIDSVDWKVGDEIVIAPSERDYDGAEKRVISAISADGKTITVSEVLKYFHYGDVSTTFTADFGTVLDMRASVGTLTRNIKITTDPTTNHGLNILVYQYTGVANDIRRGNINLDAVEISYCGHQDTERACLDIKFVLKGNMSTFSRSSIHDGLGWGINVYSSEFVTIENNVFYNTEKFSTRALFSNNFYFKKNLMIAPRMRDLTFSGLYDMVAGLDVFQPLETSDPIQVHIENNVVQGSQGNGYILAGGECNGDNGFKNNHANSLKYIGLIIGRNKTNCIEVSDLTISAADGGLITNVNANGLILKRMIFAENRIGTNANHAQESDENTIIHENIVFFGLARPNCNECYKIEDSCHDALALNIPVLQISGKSIPIDKPDPWGFLSICKDTAFDSKLKLTNVAFKNFRLDYSTDDNVNFRPCAKKATQVLFEMREKTLDAGCAIYSEKISLANVDYDSYFRLLDFNLAFKFWRGGCGDFNCTGEKNFLFTDLDGSFLKSKSQIIPLNQGIYLTCKVNPAWNAQLCDGTNFGILQFQNDGPDQRARLIAPVNITSKNMKNTLNQWREWKWEGPEPLDRRLSRFAGLFDLDQPMNMEFEVTVPDELKFQIQKGLIGFHYTIISIKYERPNTVEVWNMISKAKVVSYRPDMKIDLTTKTTVCGANVFDPDNRLITFVLTNEVNCVLKVRTLNSVKVSVHMETTIDDFYKNTGEANFIDKLVTFLKIDMSRLRIVSIRQGSVIVDFVILESKAISDSPDANLGFESATPYVQSDAEKQALLQMQQDLLDYNKKLEVAVNGGSVDLGAKVSSYSANALIYAYNNNDCLSYSSDGKCTSCKSPKILTMDKTNCATPISYCVAYSEDANCFKCDLTHSLTTSRLYCVLTINYCTSYDDSGKCLACTDPQVLAASNMKCVLPIPNCISYSDAGECLICSLGLQCPTKIENCLQYELDGRCQKCVIGLLLSFDGRGCVGAIPYCINYAVNGLCLGCSQGLGLVVNTKSTGCVKQIDYCQAVNEYGKCVSCVSDRTISYDGSSCVLPPLTPIANCLTYSDDRKCSKCIFAYSLTASLMSCVPSINYCSTYDDAGKCQSCIELRVLSSTNLKCVLSISNCLSYSDAGDCISCQVGFQCPKRIENCLQYEANGKCQKCLIGLSLSTDGLNCVGAIANCLSYSEKGLCLTCGQGMVVNTKLTGCVKPIDYCLGINEFGKCVTCMTDRIISNDGYSCIVPIPPPIDNCMTYSQDNKCLRCFYNKFLTVSRLHCVPPIPFCSSYDDESKCLSCILPRISSASRMSCVLPLPNCNSYSDAGDCLVCQLGLQCPNKIDGCLQYELNGNCQTCLAGLMISKDLSNCVAQITNCTMYSEKGLCLGCSRGLIVNIKMTGCFKPIDNCLGINEEGKCNTCMNGLLVSKDGFSCVASQENNNTTVVVYDASNNQEIIDQVKLVFPNIANNKFLENAASIPININFNSTSNYSINVVDNSMTLIYQNANKTENFTIIIPTSILDGTKPNKLSFAANFSIVPKNMYYLKFNLYFQKQNPITRMARLTQAINQDRFNLGFITNTTYFIGTKADINSLTSHDEERNLRVDIIVGVSIAGLTLFTILGIGFYCIFVRNKRKMRVIFQDEELFHKTPITDIKLNAKIHPENPDKEVILAEEVEESIRVADKLGVLGDDEKHSPNISTHRIE